MNRENGHLSPALSPRGGEGEKHARQPLTNIPVLIANWHQTEKTEPRGGSWINAPRECSWRAPENERRFCRGLRKPLFCGRRAPPGLERGWGARWKLLNTCWFPPLGCSLC